MGQKKVNMYQGGGVGDWGTPGHPWGGGRQQGAHRGNQLRDKGYVGPWGIYWGAFLRVCVGF